MNNASANGKNGSIPGIYVNNELNIETLNNQSETPRHTVLIITVLYVISNYSLLSKTGKASKNQMV